MRLRRVGAGWYETPDGRWQIIKPRMMDNDLQYRWIIRAWCESREFTGWFAFDDDYSTLSEARAALADEMSAAETLTP